jgi:Zn-dependent M28 family amino/carboxypeptidase
VELRDAERLLVGDIYTSREVMDTLEALCDDFGSRWAGSELERQAAEYFLGRFRDFGLADCALEPFEFVGWTRGTATLRVITPLKRKIDCISLPMCPLAKVEGPLVFVGDGAPKEFEALGERLRGAVAMVGTTPPRGLNRTVHRSEKYQRAALAGASAFLYVNQYEAYGPETGSIANDREAPIPGIGISKEDGALLVRLQRRHGPLWLEVTTTDCSGPRTGLNVVGTLPGNGGDDFVIVGCHYDGHDISQGAHDPASGAAALVEAARVLSLHARELVGCAIRFVLFSAEETGLIGARRYVSAHEPQLDRCRFMLNLDAAGGADRKGLTVNRWPELDPFWGRCAEEMAAELPIGQKTSAFSDHFPFFLAGVPTAMMGDPEGLNSGRGYDHTAWDTVDKVRLNDMREAASVAARLALRISREGSWPASRRSAKAVEELQSKEPSLEGQSIREAFERLCVEKNAAIRS